MSHPGEFSLLDDASVVASGTGEASFPGWLLAWFGGARGPVLRFCPGERSLYAGLGMGVLLAVAFSGISAALAVGYVPHNPVSRLWPVADAGQPGLTAPAHHRVEGPPAGHGAPTGISTFLAFLIAEPLTLRIFQPEVGAQAPLHCRWSTVHPRRSADGRGARSLGRGGTLEHSS